MEHALPFSEFRASASGSVRSWLSTVNMAGPSSSNIPSLEIPFQRWFKFKEAFSPILILECLSRLTVAPRVCLDVFGGCGTTGITCQFVGVKPLLIEVNPFVADLAEAKLQTYDLNRLHSDYISVRKAVLRQPDKGPDALGEGAPKTLCEPGTAGRYVFGRQILGRILAFREAIDTVSDLANRRLMRVLLGATLIGLSNVVVNGKGRKYRENWESRTRSPDEVDAALDQRMSSAIADLERFKRRACTSYSVLRGNCLDRLSEIDRVDVAIFSPPYPNSFDYTDIYNIELWVLGYLRTRADNDSLRKQTLRSHVQVAIPARGTPADSPLLRSVMRQLRKSRSELWDTRIPEMIEGYFSDLDTVFRNLASKLQRNGSAFVVVGDSQYGKVRVPVADILAELSRKHGFRVESNEGLRTMRSSAQQGGSFELSESLLHVQVT